MANYCKEYKQLNGPYIMLDAGNFASIQSRQQQVLSEYFMKGMKFLDYSAVLVGANEMKFGTDFILKTNKSVGLPLLSSNILSKDGKPVFKEEITVKYKDLELAVIGLSDNVQLSADDSQKVKVIAVDSAARAMASKVKKGKNTVVVLLTNMREDLLRKVLKENAYIDIAINADLPVYREQPTVVEKAIAVSHGRQTKTVNGLAFNRESGKITDAQGSSVALDVKYEKNKEIDTLFKEYEKTLTTIQFKWPRPKDAQKLYAGRDACVSCHSREAQIEETGPHLKGFASLEKAGQAYNPSCLECHVTGYERENGFWDIETSRDMAGIQCEQCHGALKNHVDEENKLPFSGAMFGGGAGAGATGGGATRQFKPYKAGFYICTRCHTDQYKLSLPPEEAWKKVGHSK